MYFFRRYSARQSFEIRNSREPCITHEADVSPGWTLPVRKMYSGGFIVVAELVAEAVLEAVFEAVGFLLFFSSIWGSFCDFDSFCDFGSFFDLSRSSFNPSVETWPRYEFTSSFAVLLTLVIVVRVLLFDFCRPLVDLLRLRDLALVAGLLLVAAKPPLRDVICLPEEEATVSEMDALDTIFSGFIFSVAVGVEVDDSSGQDSERVKSGKSEKLRTLKKTKKVKFPTGWLDCSAAKTLLYPCVHAL